MKTKPQENMRKNMTCLVLFSFPSLFQETRHSLFTVKFHLRNSNAKVQTKRLESRRLQYGRDNLIKCCFVLFCFLLKLHRHLNTDPVSTWKFKFAYQIL